MSIKENIELIKSEYQSVLASKSLKEDITLIAVSKTVDVDKIQEALEANIEHIGENKVQELVRKENALGDVVNYHMIGVLQTNKVKDLIGKTFLIHSLDRKSLLKEIERRGKKADVVMDCLIQLNIAKEDTKSGLFEEDLEDFILDIESCENVKIKGLMTIAPFVDDPEDVRYVFRRMKEIFDELSRREYKNIVMKYLSMGMSHDFKVAVEEGANMIRVGTSIFGARNYNL